MAAAPRWGAEALYFLPAARADSRLSRGASIELSCPSVEIPNCIRTLANPLARWESLTENRDGGWTVSDANRLEIDRRGFLVGGVAGAAGLLGAGAIVALASDHEPRVRRYVELGKTGM
jgi:hypothetical protein